MGHLNSVADFYLSQSLAPRTLVSYNRMFEHYQHFCCVNGCIVLPPNEQTLILYASFLAAHMSHKGIKAYLCAISHHSVMSDVYVSIPSMLKLKKLIRGIRRHQGSSFTRPLRDPITTAHLLRIYSYLEHSVMPDQDRALFWAASTLAFFGLLRVSEYTCPLIADFDETTNLMISDIKFTSNSILVFIKASKNDPFRVGCQLVIGSTPNILCPRSAMLAFVALRGLHYGPLFVYKDGSYLTRARLATFLKNIFHSELINTHSFRIGGATALSLAGFSDSQIQIIGRWRSNSFTRYLRVNKNLCKSLSKIISTVPPSSFRWNPDNF